MPAGSFGAEVGAVYLVRSRLGINHQLPGVFRPLSLVKYWNEMVTHIAIEPCGSVAIRIEAIQKRTPPTLVSVVPQSLSIYEIIRLGFSDRCCHDARRATAQRGRISAR